MSSWFGGTSSVGDYHHSQSHSRHGRSSPTHSQSRHKQSSPTRSHSHHKQASPTRSYFTRPHQGESSSSRGFFSRPHTSSSSYYKRRPRDGYISRMIHQLKRLLRQLYSYAREHPVKIFMLVIMPLITGGAAATILKQFGIRLPSALAGLGAGGGFGGGRGFEGSSYGGSGGGFGDFGGGGMQTAISLAKMFM